MTPQEIEAQLKSFEKQFAEVKSESEKNKKDFDLKLQSAEANAKQFKELAEKREEELRSFRKEADEKELKAKKQFEEIREKEIVEFAAKLKTQGIITPAQEPLVVSFMKSLTAEGEVVKFSDKSGKTVAHSQLSFFKEFMLTVKKKAVDFTETGKANSVSPDLPGQGSDDQEAEHFMDVRQEGVVRSLSVDGFDLNVKAIEYQDEMQKKGRPVSYGDALIHVEKVLAKS